MKTFTVIFSFCCLVAATYARPQGQVTAGNGKVNYNFQNPNGVSGTLGYSHQKGYGHDVNAHASVPVWQSRDRMTSLNAGGGLTQHFGGPVGSRTLDRRIGFGLTHRF